LSLRWSNFSRLLTERFFQRLPGTALIPSVSRSQTTRYQVGQPPSV
jgi:hypothetical protein